MNELTYHRRVFTAHQACKERNKKNERPGHTRSGALICTPTKKPRPHARASQPQRKSRHSPIRRTVRPVDGQTGAKRTRGGVSSRKRVRSAYSEPEMMARGKWSETHTERGGSTRAATGRPHPPLTRAREQNTDNITARRAQKETWGARHLENPDHAPHTPIRARRAQHRALKAR